MTLAMAHVYTGVLSQLLSRLHEVGILTEDLALPEDPDDLEAIYRGLCRLPNREGSKRRRIDFLTVPWTSRGAALLYYTGDDIFNRAIRMKANVLGYSLNQRGLFGGIVIYAFEALSAMELPKHSPVSNGYVEWQVSCTCCGAVATTKREVMISEGL
ncbi:hypothetical protein C0992_003642 [Termitomyces sp. T32_za158]|nr:hypothetical protein C0992_003642 [Termitomyces sp. T32_za158]